MFYRKSGRADRILPSGGTTYTVNANGNLTARGTDSFTYDQSNRLKTASVAGTSSSYLYDGDGKRASKTVGGATTSYLYDVNASLPVLLDDGTHKYVWGLGLTYAVDASGSPIVYHTDGLGSVRALTDASGDVVQTYQYSEYGVVLSSQGSISQPFQFTGEQFDPETGFSYLRARMYDAGTGRFLSRDPFPGIQERPVSLNQFGYTDGNPVTNVDHSGLCQDPGGVGLRYCIERYIPSETMWYFQGDNRGPNASGGSYRIQQLVHWTADGKLVYSVNSLTTILLNPLTGEPAYARRGTPRGYAKSKVLDDGSRVTVAYSAGSQGIIPAPPIITNIAIREQGGSAEIVEKTGTRYPSLDVWVYGGEEGPKLLYHYDAVQNTPISLIEGTRPLP